jgi:hypothetical protein
MEKEVEGSSSNNYQSLSMQQRPQRRNREEPLFGSWNQNVEEECFRHTVTKPLEEEQAL